MPQIQEHLFKPEVHPYSFLFQLKSREDHLAGQVNRDVDSQRDIAAPVGSSIFKSSYALPMVLYSNTNVSIAAYTSHRDPRTFPDSETYNLDR